MDHVTKENHVMDWDSTGIIVKESNWRTRGIKESSVIRKNTQNINRDEVRNNDLLPDTCLT